jgi:hypothetical protein
MPRERTMLKGFHLGILFTGGVSHTSRLTSASRKEDPLSLCDMENTSRVTNAW